MLIATSARVLLESAIRGGYAVAAIDGFCDREVRAHATFAARVGLREGGGLDDRELAAAIEHTTERYAKTLKAVVVGSGIEGCGSALDALERSDLQCLGNEPQRYRFAERSGCEFAADALAAVADCRAPYLYKSLTGSGGVHIYREDECSAAKENYYRQSYMPFGSVSHLFLADGRQIETIGFSTQWHSRHDAAHPFCFGGAVNAHYLDETCIAQAEAAARSFGLKGLNNIDYLYDGAQLYFLELNPRPSATMALYDMDYSCGLLHAHIEACSGKGLERGTKIASATRAFAIFYADRPVCLPSDFEWPSVAKDIPAETPAGYRFEKNAPICTLHADADDVGGVLTELQHDIRELQKCIDAISPPPLSDHQSGTHYEISRHSYQ